MFLELTTRAIKPVLTQFHAAIGRDKGTVS